MKNVRDCVVFNGLNSLDYQDVRFKVIRIPEVIKRIQQAQDIWDGLPTAGFDFANFMAAEDRLFLNNIKLKSLASAVVQIGLYDRYLRHQPSPEFFIGNSTGDAPVLVAVGRMTFAEMVKQSAAVHLPRPSAPVQLAQETQLTGMSLTQYAAYRVVEENGSAGFHEIETEMHDVQKVIFKIMEELDVRRFINVGPGNLLLDRMLPEFEMVDVQVLESIELDPMLSWFWARTPAASA